MALTGVDLRRRDGSGPSQFHAAGMSPCLRKLAANNHSAYVVRLWRSSAPAARQLAAQPRADMPGFRLATPVEVAQEAKYQARVRLEAEVRSAIVRGEKANPIQRGR